MTNQLYEKFKELGIDVTWYEKAKGDRPRTDDRPVPLSDEYCGILSIYQLTKSGKLYTTTNTGEAYQLARETGKTISRDIYLCAHCKKQFTTYAAAAKHYEGGNSEEISTDQTSNQDEQEGARQAA